MEPGDSPAVLDLAQLRGVTLDDKVLMREIVAALLADTGAQIQALRDALSRGDAGESARVAHGARGACSNVGAAALASAFGLFEEFAQAGRSQDCRDVLDRLWSELDRLRRASAALDG